MYTWDESFEVVGSSILSYWFGGVEYWKKTTEDMKNCTAFWDDLWIGVWFAKEDLTHKVDDFIRENYELHIRKAMDGEYDSWKTHAHGCLALVILLDQFSRNVYRNTAKAWAQDEKALAICLYGIEHGFDLQLKPVPRAMFYMPLLHAEDMKYATMSIERYRGLWEDATARKSLTDRVLGRFDKIAQIHYNSIKLFGRYPERNKYLLRATTPEEDAYLKG